MPAGTVKMAAQGVKKYLLDPEKANPDNDEPPLLTDEMQARYHSLIAKHKSLKASITSLIIFVVLFAGTYICWVAGAVSKHSTAASDYKEVSATYESAASMYKLAASLASNSPSPVQLPDHPLAVSFTTGPSTPPPTLELLAARRALLKLKTLLGPSALRDLLAPDIAVGNDAWHDILDASSDLDDEASPDPGTRVLAEVQFTAVPKDCEAPEASKFTALGFTQWFADSGFRHVERLWKGHPEHYGIEIEQNEDGTLGANVTEPWGPILSEARVPSLKPILGQDGGGVRKPWMKSWDGFPYQSVGEETLRDGSGKVFGNLHYSFRDLAVDNGGKTCGIELALNMWMPSKTPEEAKQGITEHLTIEYYNWVGWAYEDIMSRAFIPV